MVPADDLPRATALSQTAGSAGMMLAPALGGLLMGRFGLRVPLLADAGSYLAIAAAGRLIRTRRGFAHRPLRGTPHRMDVIRLRPEQPPGQQEGDDAMRAGSAARTGGGTARRARGRDPARAVRDGGARAAQGRGGGGHAVRGGAARGETGPSGWGVRRDPLVRAAVGLVGAVVAAASLVNVAEVFFIRATLHSTAGMYGVMESVWISASVAGGWWVARRHPSDAGLAMLLLGSLVLTCLGVALMATVPAVGWLAPVSVLGGLGNGGVNVAAGVLLARRAPAEMRGRAFAVFGAVVNGATVAGFVLGGVLLAAVPVRAIIAAAGLGGLAVTAAFALPVLRATARERDDRRAGAAEPARPLR
jgi:MFS family permease